MMRKLGASGLRECARREEREARAKARLLVAALFIAGGALTSACGSSSASNPGSGGANGTSGASAVAGSAGTLSHAGAGSGGAPGSAGMGATSAGASGLVLGDSAAEACIAYAIASCSRSRVCSGLEPSECLNASYSCPDLSLSAGSTRTPASLKACAATLATFSCDLLSAGQLPPCVSPGTRKGGEKCVYPSQCESLECNVKSSTTGCGVCKRAVALDEECSADDAECLPGLVCADGKCAALQASHVRALGDLCAPRDTCKGGYCESGTTRCVALPKAGDSCATSFRCDGDSYCDPTTRICKVLPGAGLACAPSGDASCAKGTVCQADSQSASGVCAPTPAFGEPCPTFIGSMTLVFPGGCGSGNRCDSSQTPPRCAARGHAGESCTNGDGECEPGLVCLCTSPDECTSKTTTCTKLRYAGESCDALANRCHPAFSCDAGMCVPRATQGTFDKTCP